MHRRTRTTLLGLLLLAVLAASACTIHIERNADGSLRAETLMSEESVQREIDLALADPLIQELVADLHDGYIGVSAVRKRLSGDETDELTFRLTLGVEDGHLSATISDARLNDVPIDEDIVSIWNERIARNLEKGGQRNPNSALQSVTVDEDAVTMVWRIETKQSRGE